MYLTCVCDLLIFLGVIIVYIVLAIAKRTKKRHIFFMRYRMDHAPINGKCNPPPGTYRRLMGDLTIVSTHWVWSTANDAAN